MLEWKKDWWKALIALAPMFAILIVFTFYPIFNTIAMSFFKDYDYITNTYGQPSFDVYARVLQDVKFWGALLNTFIIVIIGVPLSIMVSLLISVSLNAIPKFRGFFQTIFFLPYITNGMAFGLVFATIFSPLDSGLVNTMLSWFGIDRVAWTGTGDVIPYWAGLVVITVNGVWSGLAFKILVFSSGLAGIDKQYTQAAQIDGASKKRIFWKITLPLLRPMVLYITITSLIGAFKSYSSIVSLFGVSMGNGNDRTFMTSVGYVYRYFLTVKEGLQENLPPAAASAVLLFLFILLITALQMWYNKRRVHY